MTKILKTLNAKWADQQSSLPLICFVILEISFKQSWISVFVFTRWIGLNIILGCSQFLNSVISTFINSEDIFRNHPIFQIVCCIKFAKSKTSPQIKIMKQFFCLRDCETSSLRLALRTWSDFHYLLAATNHCTRNVFSGL